MLIILICLARRFALLCLILIYFSPLFYAAGDSDTVLCFQHMFAFYVFLNGHLLYGLKAISRCANVPPLFPAFEIMPIAPVNSIQRDGLRVKALLPASRKRGSNSTPLKRGLFNASHIPRYSIVFLSRIQFLTTSFGSMAFFCLAMSVIQI